MRVFVTGGNGFIGSVVVRELVRSGYGVACLLRETSRVDRIESLAFERAPGDVRDVASLRAAMGSCGGTIHLAAPGGWAEDDPAVLKEVIEGGTRNVLAVATELPGHRVVVVSSVAAIDASDTPRVFDEGAEFTLRDPSLHYAHAKHQAEMIAREAFARGVPVVVVNPAEVYGPGDASLGTAKHLIDFASSMPVLVCHGGTSVVHVDDVAAGILAALARGRAGERYILGGDNLTVRQLAEIVVELTGSRAPIVSVPNAIARFVSRLAIALHVPLPFDPHVVPYASRYWFVDSGKARRELGVTFRGALETIQPTLEWLEQAGHLPRRKRAAAVGPAWPP